MTQHRDASVAVDVVDIEGGAQLHVQVTLPSTAAVEGHELAQVHAMSSRSASNSSITAPTSRPPADSLSGGVMA
jgi:hypothetical protein